MDSQALASLSNLVLYAAMGVLTFAMIAFAVRVATAAPQAAAQRRARREAATPTRVAEPALVGGATGAGTAAPAGHGASAARPASGADVQDAAGKDRSGSLGMMLSWFGTMLIGASMLLRGLSVHRAPVGNMFEFAVAGSFLVMLCYLVPAMKRPLRWLGLFVVTPVLLVLGLAITVWYTAAAELVPSLKSTWLVIHVPIAILSTAVFTLAFCVLLVHFLQARREQRIAEGRAKPSDERGFLATLPDAASLDRTAYSMHVVAFPLWTFTLIAGAIWGQQAWGTYWSWDPKEVWTFVIWCVYAAYLHARATSGWSLRAANRIAVIGYVAIIVNFTIVNMYFPGMHSYSGLVTP